MFKLREYQVKAIEDCMGVLTASKKKSIAVLPTGAGKSIIIAECVKRLNKPVLILQPSKELLKQNYEKFIRVGGKASMYCASLKTKTIKKQDYTLINGELKKCKEVSNVTYATIGSIKKDLEKLKKLGVKHIIIDEAHLQSKVGSQLRSFLKKLNVTNVLGLTATPIYLEGGMMGSRLIMINRSFGTIFRSLCHITQIKELVENNYWTPFKYKIIKTDESSLQLNTAGSDYTEYSQKKYYESNNLREQIVEEVKRLKQEGRKRILIFVPDINEANSLYGLIPNSAVVHSKLSTQERDLMVEEFTNGDIPVAINVNCLDLETEILTETGWVKHDEMTYQHKVANWDKGNIYFQEPKKIIKRQLKEDEYFCTYESEAVNFRVTNQHDLLLKRYENKEYKKIKARDVKGRVLQAPVFGEYLPTKIEISQEKRDLKSSFERRVSANSYYIRRDNPEISISDSKEIAKSEIKKRDKLRYKNPHELSNEECELIGFFLGDGSISKHKNNGFRYTLSQSERYDKIIERVDEILDKIGVGYTKQRIAPSKSNYFSITWDLNKGTGFREQRRKGIYPIIPYLDKNGSKYLRYLNKEQFKNLIKGFWLADGNHGDSINKSSRGLNITNTKYELLSLLQEIGVTRGFRMSISKLAPPKKKHHKQLYKLTYSHQKNSSINNRYKIIEENHKPERVWCVSTSSTNIITRRKGKVMVMGNCLSTGYDNPEIDAIITARPTSSIALFYQQIGRGCRLHPEKEDCIIVDFSGNTTRFGRVEGLEFSEIDYYGWGLFNEQEQLLTDYPISTINKPTKQSLIESRKPKEVSVNTNSKIVLWFGKYEGKDLEEAFRQDKNYFVWVYENFTFDTPKKKELKRKLEIKLELPVTV